MGGILCTPEVPDVPIDLVFGGYRCAALVRGGVDALDRMNPWQRAWLIHQLAYNENNDATDAIEHIKKERMWDAVSQATERMVLFVEGEFTTHISYTVPPLTEKDLAQIGIHIG